MLTPQANHFWRSCQLFLLLYLQQALGVPLEIGAPVEGSRIRARRDVYNHHLNNRFWDYNMRQWAVWPTGPMEFWDNPSPVQGPLPPGAIASFESNNGGNRYWRGSPDGPPPQEQPLPPLPAPLLPFVEAVPFMQHYGMQMPIAYVVPPPELKKADNKEHDGRSKRPSSSRRHQYDSEDDSSEDDVDASIIEVVGPDLARYILSSGRTKSEDLVDLGGGKTHEPRRSTKSFNRSPTTTKPVIRTLIQDIKMLLDEATKQILESK